MVRRYLFAFIAFAAGAVSHRASAQSAPVAVVLNGEDGKSLGLAIIEPADGVSLLLPASASIARVAPGASEVTAHAVRWSSAQVAGIDRLVVVVRIATTPHAPPRVVVSNGTDVRTVILSAPGTPAREIVRTSSMTPRDLPTAHSTVLAGQNSDAGWLSVAASHFSGTPVPAFHGSAGVTDAAPDARSQAPQPNPRTPRPVPAPMLPPAVPPEPRPGSKSAIYSLVSRQQPAAGDGRPVDAPASLAALPHIRREASAIAPRQLEQSPSRAAAPEWRFVEAGTQDAHRRAPAVITRSSASDVLTSAAPVAAQPSQTRRDPNPTPVAATVGYSIGDLFTSTGFPSPTRILPSSSQPSAGAGGTPTAPPDALAVASPERDGPQTILRAAATRTGAGSAAVAGGELAIERPVAGSMAFTVTAGATAAKQAQAPATQYVTAGVRIAPGGASTSSLSPFLSIALGLTTREAATETRMAFAGGIQVPMGSRAMFELAAQGIATGHHGLTPVTLVGIRALLGGRS